jgi:hypothetical protein
MSIDSYNHHKNIILYGNKNKLNTLHKDILIKNASKYLSIKIPKKTLKKDVIQHILNNRDHPDVSKKKQPVPYKYIPNKKIINRDNSFKKKNDEDKISNSLTEKKNDEVWDNSLTNLLFEDKDSVTYKIADFISKGTYGKTYKIENLNKDANNESSKIPKIIKLETKSSESSLFLEKNIYLKIKNLIKSYENTFTYHLPYLFSSGILQLKTISYYYIIIPFFDMTVKKKFTNSRDDLQYQAEKVQDNILCALDYLHNSLNYFHFDIKHNNIMYSQNQDKYILIDFGMSWSIKTEKLNIPNNNISLGNKMFGSRIFYQEKIVNYKTDIEMLLFTILYCFNDVDMINLFVKIDLVKGRLTENKILQIVKFKNDILELSQNIEYVSQSKKLSDFVNYIIDDNDIDGRYKF